MSDVCGVSAPGGADEHVEPSTRMARKTRSLQEKSASGAGAIELSANEPAFR
jgi:hypothetical protein